MIGFAKKVEVLPLQSEANANYNPFPDATPVTDIQAIKTAFLADQDVLSALKGNDGQAGPQGEQGQQGQAGPAGDSLIVRDTDPTDAISSKVGDLYLNTTSGTLYQRSGITQAQFYGAGLQGLVLPNSIWIRKGNLKGATGEKGDKGDGIMSGSGHPSFVFETLPPVGTLYINKNTFMMYERRATQYIPGNIPEELPEDYTLGYWYVLGSLQGPQGNEGQAGPAGDSIIVRDNDPTDAISSKVGDLYLNTTSGTLYQRSGITQAQFYGAGLQGLVLPNSIWIRKGNLKGAIGEKGDSGLRGSIWYEGNGSPRLKNDSFFSYGKQNLDHYLDTNTYFKYIYVSEINDWISTGTSLKGATGDKGDVGDTGYKILSGTGNYLMVSTDIGKIVIIPNASEINSISLNSLINGDFLLYNFKSVSITVTKTNQAPIAVPIGAKEGVMISVSDSTFTWVEIGSLTNNNFVDKEIPSGLINGSNNTYTLSNVPIVGSEHVYVNGLLMNEGMGNDYTISGDTITMLSTLNVGEKLRVSYRK